MAIASESLELAVEMEEEGYKYYKQAAEETSNQLSKSVLESLANQEMDHIDTIKEIAQGKGVSGAEVNHDYIEAEVKEVFSELSAEETEDWKDEDTEAYKQALEMEEKLYSLYEDMAAEADDPEEKEFLEALMKEEEKHQESLQNVLYYYTDSGHWIADDESKVWNWMNIQVDNQGYLNYNYDL